MSCAIAARSSIRRRRPCAEPAADDDDRPPGGWGIQLVRRYTDEMRYTREAGENVLRLTKRLSAGDQPRITLPIENQTNEN